jgi:hypothetical protein
MALFNSGSLGADHSPPARPQPGKETPMALKEYSTVINGQATTLQLSDEDAKLQGFTKKDLVSSQEVEVTDAQREAENEAAVQAKAAAAKNKEAAAPQNKSATTQAKKDDAG